MRGLESRNTSCLPVRVAGIQQPADSDAGALKKAEVGCQSFQEEWGWRILFREKWLMTA